MEKDFWARLAECQDAFTRWEKKWKKLKEHAGNMYLENQELKNENEELKKIIKGQKDNIQKGQAGYENLRKLYKENYHICPLNFGDRRTGDCLFCREFLQKAYRGE